MGQGFKNPNQLIDRLKLLQWRIYYGRKQCCCARVYSDSKPSKLNQSLTHDRTKENDGGNEKISG